MLSRMQVLTCDDHDPAVNDTVFDYVSKVNVEFKVLKLPMKQPDVCHKIISDTINLELRQGDHLAIYDIHNVARTYNQAVSFCDTLAHKGVTFHIVRHNLEIRPCEYTNKILDFVGHLYRIYVLSNSPKFGRPKGCKNKSLKLDVYRDQILEYTKLNISKSSIAKLIDCNVQTLSNWLARNNIYISGTRKLDGREQEILACFRNDMTMAETADKFNVSRETLRDWLKDKGLYASTWGN